MSHLKSSTRLFLLAGVLSTLLLAIGGLGRFATVKSNDALKTLYQDRIVPMGLLADIRHQLLLIRLLIEASALDPTREVIASNVAELASRSSVINKAWTAYRATYLTAEEERLAARLSQDRLKFEQEGLLPALVALRASDMATVRRLILERVGPLDTQLQLGLESLMQLQLDVARQEYQAALDRSAVVRVVSLGTIVAGVLFAILTSLALIRARRQELAVMLEREAHAGLTRLLEVKSGLLQSLERQQQELVESEFRWKFAIEGAGDGVWDRNIGTGEETYSTRWKAMLGYQEGDILPTNQEWERRIHPDDHQAVIASDRAYLAGQIPVCESEFRMRCKDGSYKWILSRGMIVSRDRSGVPLRMIGTHTDITHRKHTEEQLRLTESLFRESINTLDAGFVIYDANDRLVVWNKTYRDYLVPSGLILESGAAVDDVMQEGCTFEDVLRLRVANGIYPADVVRGEGWIAKRVAEHRKGNQDIIDQLANGRWIKIRDQRTPSGYLVGLRVDVSELYQAKQAAEGARKKLEEKHQELERMARYDSLTKLPNRAMLAERLEQALALTRRRGQHLAVVFVDLDGFKAVNDTHGHDAGDHLLITLAERMKQTLRDGDILARLGGDEFVAVLLDLPDVDASAPMLNRLLAAAAQAVQFGQARLQVSASLGVTFYPETAGQAQEMEPDQLLRQADQAMYQAKQSGKNRFCVFDPEQDRNVRSRLESMQSIERALNDGEFVLEYQPKVNLRTGAVIGVEALIRWLHPQKGLLPPADFLPMIEDHPLAVKLGQWVIENALLQIERWQQDGLKIAVSVNIGRRHLMQAGFVQGLRETLAAHPLLKPDCLELELLETSALDDLPHVSQVIKECRYIGVQCALDDFGSGHSSLTGLKKLPVKYVKIDQNFICDMLDSSDSLLMKPREIFEPNSARYLG